MTVDGILNVYKTPGMTSHDVVRQLRRLTGMKRIGHTGTLDPMAKGVLPILMGNATRIMEYLDVDAKVYRCRMALGRNTDTLDAWGETTEIFSTEGVTEARIRDAFSAFHGVIEQRPPMYSAVRVAGKRLYAYARAGETVEVPVRRVCIRALTVDAIDLAAMTVTFTVVCSKGTYIRTLCQDVGTALGTGGYMTDLERLASGVFRAEDAVTLEELAEKKEEADRAGTGCQDVAIGAGASGGEDVSAKGSAGGRAASMYQTYAIGGEDAAWLRPYLLPTDTPLVHFGKALISPDTARQFIDGWHVPLEACRILRQPPLAEVPAGQDRDTAWWPVRPVYRQAYCLYRAEPDARETFLGVAFYSDQYHKLVADKVLYRG